MLQHPGTAHSISARICPWLQLLIQHTGSWQDTISDLEQNRYKQSNPKRCPGPTCAFLNTEILHHSLEEQIQRFLPHGRKLKVSDTCSSPGLSLSQMQILLPHCWPLPPQLARCLMASLGQNVFPKAGLGPLKKLAKPFNWGPSKIHI